jgi:hypothetical protein
MSTLISPYKQVRVSETIENYAVSDNHKTDTSPSKDGQPFLLWSEEEFWHSVLYKPENFWNTKVTLDNGFVLTEWVARVPGLYWQNGSAAMRAVTQTAVETIGNQWNVLRPVSKSMIVMGGVGTLKLPPNEDGYRLVTLTATGDASAGIPTLISESIWQKYSLHEGIELKGTGVWKEMPMSWSKNFPSTAKLPRGCLYFNEDSNIQVLSENQGYLFHPFSVMEYTTDSGIFHDFVFVSVTSEQQNYRQAIKDFFGYYRTANNRVGKYILNIDVSQPILDDVLYNTPQELLKTDDFAQSQLDILLARVRGDTFKNDKTIEDINKALLQNFGGDTEGLKRIGEDIGIPAWEWFKNESAAKLSIKLLDLCLEKNKMEALLEALVMDNPTLLQG